MATADELSEAFDLNSKISDLEERVRILERSVPQPAHDFGGVTSTGAPKMMTRWVIVSGENALSPGHGFVPRSWRTGEARPVFFKNAAEAETVRSLLFPVWEETSARVYQVEVIERDGRLIEARYA